MGNKQQKTHIMQLKRATITIVTALASISAATASSSQVDDPAHDAALLNQSHLRPGVSNLRGDLKRTLSVETDLSSSQDSLSELDDAAHDAALLVQEPLGPGRKLLWEWLCAWINLCSEGK